MVAIVLLQVSGRNGRSAFGLPAVNYKIAHHALFRDGIGVTGFVVVEKGLQFSIGRLDGFFDVFGGNQRVIKLDFGVPLFVGFLQFRGSNVRARGDGGDQLALE